MPYKINPFTGKPDYYQDVSGVVTSVSGTPNRITVTGTTTPTIDIAATYVGQTSLTTLGTITTGTWNATVVAGQYGGTGVANTGKTITLGGNLTTSGAFASTFTMTGVTGVTFPTSGTLATTSQLLSSPLTTKGDVWGYSTVNARIPVGTDGQVLTADSAQTLGLKWATPTTGTVTSVSGTANRITSTGGTTPVIDISASYVGQSSITTLGTIGTGVWQGTLVGSTYGGTGVNNGSSTITLGGSLTTSGAFASTFTMTGATSVTFPTSGTLATTSQLFTWSVITADQTAVVNNGYICNKGSALVLTLPSSANIGDIIEVTGINTALGWKIAQNANQQINFGNVATTLGASGYIQSSAIRDSIKIVCVVSGASTIYNVLSAQGNPTVV